MNEIIWQSRKANDSSELPANALENVSVIICARNEAEHLRKYLPLILQQDYMDDKGRPAFEVIVVNDSSTDSTGILLSNFIAEYSHLSIINIDVHEPRLFPGKKHALAKGVAAAKHEIILMTDADCQPASSRWIAWMAFPFSRQTDIVAGHGDFMDSPGFLNKFIRCETRHTFALYARFCLKGMPYMAVGRNLACRKQTMITAQQNPLWQKTASGDDDMLIRICANKTNMVVNSHPDSFTYSIAKESYREYLNQKQRHVSTGKFYASKIKLWLSIYAMSHALFWVTVLALILYTLLVHWNPIGFFSAVAFVVIRGLYFYPGLHHWGRSSHSKDLILFWPVFDFCWMIYNIILSPYILWKSRQRWR